MPKAEINYTAHSVEVGEWQAWKVDFDTRIDDSDKANYVRQLLPKLFGMPLPRIIEITWPSNHNVIIVYCEQYDD